MALTVIRFDDLDGFESEDEGRDVFVMSDVLVTSDPAALAGAALRLFGVDHVITIRGSVVGDFAGLDILPSGNDVDAKTMLTVSQGGLLAGDYAARLYGYGHQVVNHGEILGERAALLLVGNGASSQVHNLGLISAEDDAIDGSFGSQSVTLRNSGTIIAGVNAFEGGSGSDAVFNRGVIEGVVLLGNGGDRFDNRGGRIEGPVYGGAGNDLFTPGADDEIFYGGEGIDTLDFRSSSGVRASLGDTNGTGWAAGDFYDGFETLWGSFGGADSLFGNGARNTIMGFGGNDLLVGGRGVDTLHGGDGDDRFRYDSILDRGDIIADWGSTTGDDDTFVLRAAGFGGDLVPGALSASRFVARADNVAQDALDRFVFRTTDRSLWFDVDGSGAAQAVMLADLQAGAVVKASDILLV